jgi:hypothetical protein
MAIGVSGQSITSSQGTATVTSNPIILPTGLSTTASVGAISPADVMGLTGVSMHSFSVGSIAPADQIM